MSTPVEHHVVSDHEVEHYRCEQLGEGAQVPVTCSCGESWVGAHEFHISRRKPGECRECDAVPSVRIMVKYTDREPVYGWWPVAQAKRTLALNSQAWRDQHGVEEVRVG